MTNATNVSETSPLNLEIAKKSLLVILIGLICVSGLVGYSVYFYIFIKHRKTLNNSFYCLSVSMLIPDTINLLSQIVYSIPAILWGENSLPDLYRIIVGYLTDGAWFWSSSHMVAIGINRVAAVCFITRYQRMFRSRNVYIVILCCWLYGFIMVTTMYACGCQYHFQTYSWVFVCEESYCKQSSMTANKILSSNLVLCVVLCYIIIFVQVRGKSKKVAGTTNKQIDKKQKQEFQLIFQFVVIGISLSLYALTFWIVPALVEKGSLSDCVGLNFMNIFSVVNSAVHPFMYIFFGSEVKEKIFRNINNGKQQTISRSVPHEGNINCRN